MVPVIVTRRMLFGDYELMQNFLARSHHELVGAWLIKSDGGEVPLSEAMLHMHRDVEYVIRFHYLMRGNDANRFEAAWGSNV